MNNFNNVAKEIIEAFNKNKVKFILVGGGAINFLGDLSLHFKEALAEVRRRVCIQV